MGYKKVLTYAGIWSVILIGFYLGFWRPRIEQLKKSRTQVIMQQTVINQLRKDIESYPKTITAEALRDVEKKLEELFARIPAKEELPEILDQIRLSGSKSKNFEITGILNATPEQKPDPQKSTIPKMTYQMTVEGDARDILRFMYELENGVRLISIEDFALHRINEEKRSIRANLTFDIFYAEPGNLSYATKLPALAKRKQ